MTTLIRDLKNNLTVLSLLEAQVVAATVSPTTGVDTIDHNRHGGLVVFDVGEITDGTYVAKLQHADANSDGDFADVAGAAFEGVLSTNDQKVLTMALPVGVKRYVRLVVTETVAGTTGGPLSCVLLLPQRSN